MAKIIKRENQNIASSKRSKITNKMLIPIHSNIDKINPPIPSPTETLGVSKVGVVLLINSPLLKFLNFGKSSTSPTPL